MNKDEIVKDITKTICEFENPCNECEFNTKEYRCSYKAYAEQVYNAGYRKVADDEIVVNKSMYDLEKAFYKEKCAEFALLCYDYHKAKQETAREILTTIYNRLRYATFQQTVALKIVKDLANKYGIELE